MKMHENCLPCLVNQAVRVARLTDLPDRTVYFREIFELLSKEDFTHPAPEVCGLMYETLKKLSRNEDPYRNVRQECNALMRSLRPQLRERINASSDPFASAVKYAILGNIIDFSAPGALTEDRIIQAFAEGEERVLAIDDTAALKKACASARSVLYLGDNCGEVVADALLLEQIRLLNPGVRCLFAVRGTAVVNDVILSDAEECGIGDYAEVIDNGDLSQGIVLDRVSSEFLQAYHAADVVIAKGQGNYEGLTEAPESKHFCLLMAKCDHIAEALGVRVGDLVTIRLHD